MLKRNLINNTSSTLHSNQKKKKKKCSNITTVVVSNVILYHLTLVKATRKRFSRNGLIARELKISETLTYSIISQEV